MSSHRVVCGECGSPEARAVGIDSVFCDDCRAVDLGTCVKCGELAAETSRVTADEILPVCYRCKSV
ncbi:hypothetical protein [Halorarius litoreus]|uniref:hypothetical protein n=1 Tax=Halorarius litoreus TaxID=2962676 RepID=UPI0020CDE850|nr:hypothetical protein [Halorarius litoreus]